MHEVLKGVNLHLNNIFSHKQFMSAEQSTHVRIFSCKLTIIADEEKKERAFVRTFLLSYK